MELKIKTFAELTTLELYEILRSRSEIFVTKLKMTCQDIDGIDLEGRHYFFEENGRVAAYLRAFAVDDNTVRIGRVLTLEQGKGIGKRFLCECIKQIKKDFGVSKIALHSQIQVMGFYEKLGFVPVTDEFVEENVVHIGMEREI